jgi:hypothetical protein
VSGRSPTGRVAILLIAAALCWLGAQALGKVATEQRSTWPPTEDYAFFLPPPASAPVIFAGYRELAADIYWVRTLVYYGSSMVGDADYRYLEPFMDTVIALDPKFKRIYKWAAYAVTFKEERATQEEFLTSIKYLERGIEEFPDGYELYLIAGQRYFLDLYSEDPDEQRRFRERGAELIEQAMRKKDAPRSLGTFAATLRTKLGQKERALHNLREMILATTDERAQQQLIARYEQIAQEGFPEEARQAKADIVNGWKRELPFAGVDMYIILGDRPSPVIDFEALATERDLFGADEPFEAAEPFEVDEPDEASGSSGPEPDGSASSAPPAPPEAQHLP